ncbi:hypothetical protein GCM10022228_04990 [Halomonas cibimaris]|uniref:Uncharacterized protein n=2 Tax=Halomonadaceae TaxID=28256 RepID=A0ABP7L951_9GAMM
MAWRRDIQSFAAAQLNASSQRVNMGCAVMISVQYGAAGVLIVLKSCERGSLPLLDDGLNLSVRGVVIGSPGDNTTRITPFVPAAICD